jgi:tripartite-type tricarboxylate transporter receptor subunit TctC
LAEAGVPDVDAASWYALLVPAETPAAIVTKLNSTVTDMVASADYQERLAGQGFAPASGKSGSFPVFLRQETLKWGRVIESAGIRGVQGAR